MTSLCEEFVRSNRSLQKVFAFPFDKNRILEARTLSMQLLTREKEVSL